MSSLSIIIPTLNEAAGIGATLDELGEAEIFVVDGGSTDETAAIAESKGVAVLSSAPGRAQQMNAGAAAAKGDWLLFLHADTQLPDRALESILSQPESIVGGGFLRRFDSSSFALKLTCFFSDIRSKRGLFLGDQALFVRRAVFEELAGFDETLSLCEDLDFSHRLKRVGETAALSGPAMSSARRFEKRGPLVQSLIDIWITLRFFAGHRFTSPRS